MAKVLLTGASGFIGRHALTALEARGYEVHAVSKATLPSALATRSGVRWYQADLLDRKQVWDLVARVSPTHLLHLAWYAEPGKFWTAPENIRWVQGSMELLQAFESSGGRRVVMAGTCAEYGWNSGSGVHSEMTSPLVPATLYGACKHAVHVILEAFARMSGLSYAWARVFFPYGPHEHPDRLVAYAIRSMLTGAVVNCTHGRQVRDLLYVEDVAAAFVALLDSEVAGAVNIGSGEGVTLKEVIEKVAMRLGRQDLLRFGTVAARADEPPALLADVGRLRDEVGFAPRHSLESGIDKTIEWWKQHEAS